MQIGQTGMHTHWNMDSISILWDEEVLSVIVTFDASGYGTFWLIHWFQLQFVWPPYYSQGADPQYYNGIGSTVGTAVDLTPCELGVTMQQQQHTSSI